MKHLKQKLKEALQTEPSFLDAESGEINYIKVKDSADTVDAKLIALLADSPDLKEKFFTKIKDVYVFNIRDFKFFLDENKIDNSYTRYANRIGLSDNNGPLGETGSVVLDFPFKDCVLEGGQSTEEGTDTYFEQDKTGEYQAKTAKRNEIFFNQVLAHDEIDRLLDKKAFVNWKRFTKASGKNGEDVGEIKGNNLLALHSLESEFTGKVKLIYIDPPYNTGTDSFAYNDNFTHSTWLTFMKNRLEIARELLSDDGVIFVSIDDREYSYLRILMDEIFEQSNYRNVIKWRKVLSAKSQSKNLSSVSEYIIVFSKSEAFQYKEYYLETDTEKDKDNYRYTEEATGRVYRLSDFTQKGQGPAKYFGDKLLNPPSGKHWIWSQDKINEAMSNNRIVFSKTGMPSVKRYLDEKMGIPLSDLWSDDDVKIISANDKERRDFDGQKPEGLLKRIIEIATDKNDIVLDYRSGTGTTCSVAQKLGRQWIGIEQMNYQDNNPETRLQSVIMGDNTGISKEVNWTGGGNFIYLELAKWNDNAKEEIQNTKDFSALVKMFDTLYERYFLNYNLKIKEFKEKVVKEEEFKKLSLDEQKRMFLTMLDLNQMYVNESEMADNRFGISTEDQKLTNAFYGKK